MTFLEKDLEIILYEAMQDNKKWDSLNNRGLERGKPYKSKRQFHIGNYGTCDLITLERPGFYKDNDQFFFPENYLSITVYELKQNRISLNSLIQLVRYMKGINQWMKLYKKIEYNIQGVLIGREIDINNDYIYLFEYLCHNEENTFGNISTFTYNYDIDGIKFNQEYLTSYTLINEGF